MLAGSYRSGVAAARVAASDRAAQASFDDGPFALASLDETDMPGVAAVIARYRTLGVQLADAALVHLANREGIETVFTLDRRNFSIHRPV
jgi:hypothetical protein